MLIAHLSDTHILADKNLLSGWLDTPYHLAEGIRWINHLAPKPDLVIITGDLVHNGTLAEYQLFKTLLKPLQIPTLLLLGNHDNREHFRTTFKDNPLYTANTPTVHYAVNHFPLRLIALDSLISGKMHGELDKAQLLWLTQALEKAPNSPTIIMLHHPPFNTGIVAMDAIKCRNGDDLAEIVSAHPQVVRVLSGHVHRPVTVHWANTLAMTAPSFAATLGLELNPLSPDVIIPWAAQESPALLLHTWQPDTPLVTHVATLPIKNKYVTR